MSGIFGNRLVRLLRRLKHKISPPDGPRGYERRLHRELSRVARTFKGKGKPVLIHTYGKVGSTAIHTAISALPGFGSFQTHFISEEGVAEARRIHQEHDRDPIHLKLGEALRAALAAEPERRVRVITLVRDPVARAVSDLFENPTLLVGEGDIRQLPLARVVEIAAEQVINSLAYTEKWFDQELSGVLGFDFFARKFDQEQGFEISSQGRFELLAGKLELLSNHGAGFLGRFLELGKDLPIARSRSRAATGEASLYDQVRKNLKLPGEVLDEVYASRFCQHFYTPAEREAFRNLWIQP